MNYKLAGLKNVKTGLKRTTKNLSGSLPGSTSSKLPLQAGKVKKIDVDWKNAPNQYDSLNALNNRVNEISRIYSAIQTEPKEQDTRGPIARFLNLNQHQGFFGNAMEVITRPMEGIESMLGANKQKLYNSNKFQGDDPLINFWNGLSGKTKLSGVQLWKDWGVNINNPALKFIAELGTDTLTDPLMFIPGLNLGELGEGVAKILRPIMKVGTSILRKTEIGSKFLDKYLLRFSHSVKTIYKNAFGKYSNKMYAKMNDAHNALKNMLDVASTANLKDIKALDHSVYETAGKMHDAGDVDTLHLKRLLTGKDNPTKDELHQSLTTELFHELERMNKLVPEKVIQHLIQFHGRMTLPFVEKDLGKALIKLAGVKDIAELTKNEFSEGGLENLLKKHNSKPTNALLSYVGRLRKTLKRFGDFSDISNDERDLIHIRTNGGDGLSLRINKHISNSALRNTMNKVLKARNTVMKYGKIHGTLGALNKLSKDGSITADMSDPVQKKMIQSLISGQKFSKDLKMFPILKDENGKAVLNELHGLNRDKWKDYLNSTDGKDLASWMRDRYGTEDSRAMNTELARINTRIGRWNSNSKESGILDHFQHYLSNPTNESKNAFDNSMAGFFKSLLGSDKQSIHFLLNTENSDFRNILKDTFKLNDDDIDNLNRILKPTKSIEQSKLNLINRGEATSTLARMANKKQFKEIGKILKQPKGKSLERDINSKFVRSYKNWFKSSSNHFPNKNLFSFLHDPKNTKNVEWFIKHKYVKDNKAFNIWKDMIAPMLKKQYGGPAIDDEYIADTKAYLLEHTSNINKTKTALSRIASKTPLTYNNEDIKQLMNKLTINLHERDVVFKKETNDAITAIQNSINESKKIMVTIGTIDSKAITNIRTHTELYKFIDNLYKEKNLYQVLKSKTLLDIIGSDSQLRAAFRTAGLNFSQLKNNANNIMLDIASIAREMAGDNKTILDAAIKASPEGFLRHTMDPSTFLFKELVQSPTNELGVKIITRRLKSMADSSDWEYTRQWLGTAKDINQGMADYMINLKHLEIDSGDTGLLRTDPFRSMAVQLKILPTQFLARNLMQSIIDSGLITQVPEEEIAKAEKILTQRVSENITRKDAVNFALRSSDKFNEFKVIDNNVMVKLDKLTKMITIAGAKDGDIEAFQNSLDKLKNLQDAGIIHSGIYNKLSKYVEMTETDKHVRYIMGGVKSMTTLWKKTALLSIGFHVRNFFSNYMNAWTSGVGLKDSAVHLKRAFPLMKNIYTKIPKLVREGIRDKEIKDPAMRYANIDAHLRETGNGELWDKYNEYRKNGLFGATRMSNEHFNLIRKLDRFEREGSESSLEKSRIVKSANKLVAINLGLTKLSDDAWRAAMYEFGKTDKGIALMRRDGIGELKDVLDKDGKKVLDVDGNVKRTFEPDAARFSKRIFFDYSDTTAFENKYMKSIFPFYTWMRKNVELQLQNMKNHPKRYLTLAKTVTSLQQSLTKSPDDLAQYTKDGYLIPVPGLGVNGNITFMKMNMPMLDIGELIDNPLTRLNPFLQVPLEKLTGKDFFTGKDDTSTMAGNMMGSFFWDAKGFKSFFNMNQPTSTADLGMGGQRVNNIFDPLFKIFGQKGGIKGISDLLPSVFKTNDIMKNRINAQRERLFQYEKYLQQLEAQGKRVPSLSELPGAYRPSPRYGKNAGSKYRIKSLI